MRPTTASNVAQERANCTGIPHAFYEDLTGRFEIEPAPQFSGRLSVRERLPYITADGLEVEAVVVPPEEDLR
jgi:hypothetical protein